MENKIIIIPTTQNIELEYPLANVGDRIAATVIDWVLLGGYALLVFKYAGLVAVLRGVFQMSEDVAMLVLLSPMMAYSLVCESLFQGQTLGKRLRQIRVIGLDGKTPSFFSLLLRWLMRPLELYSASGVIALIAVSSTKRNQRIGDLLAGTSVIKLKLATSFAETMFVDTNEEYKVQFPQIRNLSDKDVAILKEILDIGLRNNNPDLLRRLATRIKEVAGVESRLPSDLFLETILADYNHIFGR